MSGCLYRHGGEKKGRGSRAEGGCSVADKGPAAESRHPASGISQSPSHVA
jgi:hypothetical protein